MSEELREQVSELAEELARQLEEKRPTARTLLWRYQELLRVIAERIEP